MKILVGLIVVLLGLETQDAFALSKKECKTRGKTLYLNVGKEYNAQLEYTDCASGKTVVQKVEPGYTWNVPHTVFQKTKVKVKVKAVKNSSEVISGAYDIGDGLTIVCNNSNRKITGHICSCNGKPCGTLK